MNQSHEMTQESSNPSQESTIPTPPALYKFCSFNEWTQSIFERNEIYFQSPDCFNDPFDSKIPTTYEGTEDQRISRLKDIWRKGISKGFQKEEPEETLHENAVRMVKTDEDVSHGLNTSKQTLDRMRKRLGIFCMTHPNQKGNILMWSHYADKHTGFCLEFQTEDEFFWRAMPIEERHYSAERPCINLINPPNSKEMTEALLSKAKGWEYEEEWRIIDHKKGPGPQTYPPEALSGVILGCRISPENRQRITQWCRARNPQPTIYWAHEKDREFGLEFMEIKESRWGG